jgi:hypothetical protein
MARWLIREIDAIPTVADGEPGGPTWFPLQHALGIDTFGVNVFAAVWGDETLVEEHDERGSGQQELYLVLTGRALFELDGERAEVGARTAVAVTDPSVRRSARALEAGTSVLVVGAAAGPFVSTWDATHFDGIPRPG